MLPPSIVWCIFRADVSVVVGSLPFVFALLLLLLLALRGLNCSLFGSAVHTVAIAVVIWLTLLAVDVEYRSSMLAGTCDTDGAWLLRPPHHAISLHRRRPGERRWQAEQHRDIFDVPRHGKLTELLQLGQLSFLPSLTSRNTSLLFLRFCDFVDSEAEKTGSLALN